MFANMAIDECK